MPRIGPEGATAIYAARKGETERLVRMAFHFGAFATRVASAHSRALFPAVASRCFGSTYLGKGKSVVSNALPRFAAQEHWPRGSRFGQAGGAGAGEWAWGESFRCPTTSAFEGDQPPWSPWRFPAGFGGAPPFRRPQSRLPFPCPQLLPLNFEDKSVLRRDCSGLRRWASRAGWPR